MRALADGQRPAARARSSAFLVLVCYFCGCATTDELGNRFVTVDSAGVIVSNSVAPRVVLSLADGASLATAVPPDFAEPDHQLYGADRAAILSDGSFVVGNRGTAELFFFSATGELEGVLGGQGDGPGEFQRLRDLHLCGDDVLVVEEVSRVSFVDGADRRFEHTVPIAGHLAESNALLTGVGMNCVAALLEEGPADFPPYQPGIFDFTATVYWSHFATGAPDTVGVFLDRQVAYVADFPIPLPAPYGKVGVRAAIGENVVIGVGDAYEYQVFDADGALLRIVRWQGPSTVLSDADWQHFELARAERLEADPQRARFEPPLGSYSRPSSKPPYAGIKVDDRRRVWIQAYGVYGAEGVAEAPIWWVFAENGDWLAEVQLPDGVEMLDVGVHRLVGLAQDSLGLETIEVYSFDVPATGG